MVCKFISHGEVLVSRLRQDVTKRHTQTYTPTTITCPRSAQVNNTCRYYRYTSLYEGECVHSILAEDEHDCV